jgi:hypothetical protein
MKKIKFPYIIIGGCLISLLAYEANSYMYLFPILSQIFGFGIFSCLSMLKSQTDNNSRIVVLTLLALNCSNIILYISNQNLYFEVSMLIIAIGVILILWNEHCR